MEDIKTLAKLNPAFTGAIGAAKPGGSPFCARAYFKIKLFILLYTGKTGNLNSGGKILFSMRNNLFSIRFNNMKDISVLYMLPSYIRKIYKYLYISPKAKNNIKYTKHMNTFAKRKI
jgi:hypothetical protein